MLSIGEVAKRAGVSVQTVRHYGKLGLLVPLRVSATGYRRYSESDCERLHLIRVLREVGFDLETIAQLLDSKLKADEALRIQLGALESEQRMIQRRQLLLRAAMRGKRRSVLTRLQQKHVLAKLDRLEREHFLQEHLGWAPHDTPASEAVWRAAVFDLPKEMDDAQLAAWLELAEIVIDERFQRTLQRQFEWGRALSPNGDQPNQSFQHLLCEVIRAIRAQETLDDATSLNLLDVWIHGFARFHRRRPDAKFMRWMLESLESCHDPQIARYWQLMCTVKCLPYDPAYAQASAWILDALRVRVPPL
jgi:DNA-binding transcriptional MerR regulator